VFNTFVKTRRLDLTKGDKHNHPDIVVGDMYLVRIDKQWFLGQFSTQRYGLHFGPWINGVGLQYDTPGSNSSSWEAICEFDADHFNEKIGRRL
jgi:hypothetical protein